MNILQSNHSKALKRKSNQKVYSNFHKTGRLKVKRRQQKELEKKVMEAKAKAALESKKNDTSIPVEPLSATSTI